MRYVEFAGEAGVREPLVYESPQLIGPVKFGVEKSAGNSAMVDKLTRNGQLINKTSSHEIVLTGNWQKGELGRIDTRSHKLDYYVAYETKTYGFLGKTVTQIAVWKPETSLDRTVASDIFFNYLLKHFPSVISDQKQTDHGRRFWIARMKEATQRGMTVGLVNMNDKSYELFDKSKMSFDDWIEKQDSAWSPLARSTAMRFFVTTSMSNLRTSSTSISTPLRTHRQDMEPG